VRAQGDIRNSLSTGAGGTKITIERDKAVTNQRMIPKRGFRFSEKHILGLDRVDHAPPMNESEM